jgi:hypothetical protein
MSLTRNTAGQWVCHCGTVAQNGGSPYDWVCAAVREGRPRHLRYEWWHGRMVTLENEW